MLLFFHVYDIGSVKYKCKYNRWDAHDQIKCIYTRILLISIAFWAFCIAQQMQSHRNRKFNRFYDVKWNLHFLFFYVSITHITYEINWMDIKHRAHGCWKFLVIANQTHKLFRVALICAIWYTGQHGTKHQYKIKKVSQLKNQYVIQHFTYIRLMDMPVQCNTILHLHHVTQSHGLNVQRCLALYSICGL